MNSDSDLKNGLKAGDRDLFRQVFLNSYPGMVRYSASLTGDTESAREIVQDIFLELWEKRDVIGITGSVKSYLFGAVYNRSLNFIRNRRIRETYAANPSGISNWLHFPTETGSSDPLLLDKIEKAIEALPSRCREAFTRGIINGEPQKELAANLGVSVKTIENQITRARKILKSKIRNLINE